MRDNQQPSSGLRVCKKCGQLKPINEFQVYSKTTGAQRHECDICRRAYQAAWARGEIVVSADDTHRTCRVCGQKKPTEEFAVVYSKNRRGKLYRQHTCILCYRSHAAEKERRRRSANREKFREYNRRRYWKYREKRNIGKKASHQKTREYVFRAYGGFLCKCCGETEPTMLTIDHIDGNGSDHRKNDVGARNLYYWLIHNGFPSGFQVLCYNCNISKFRNGGICSHQPREGSTTISKESRAKRLEVPRVP